VIGQENGSRINSHSTSGDPHNSLEHTHSDKKINLHMTFILTYVPSDVGTCILRYNVYIYYICIILSYYIYIYILTNILTCPLTFLLTYTRTCTVVWHICWHILTFFLAYGLTYLTLILANFMWHKLRHVFWHIFQHFAPASCMICNDIYIWYIHI